MSMIAIQENEYFPLLFSDLLFSSPSKDDDFTYPTYNTRIDLHMDWGMHPARMIQKTYIVHPNIAVVTAGYAHRIRYFINEIKQYFLNHEASISNLDCFTSSYPFEVGETYGICVADSKNGTFDYRYFGTWNEKTYAEVGRIRTAASGGIDFLQVIDSFDETGYLLPVDSYRNSITNACICFSNVLGDERYYGSDIKHAWGAGFEIAVYDYANKQFKKLDDINYIVWRAKYDIGTEKLDVSPLSIMTYKYFDEVLCICSHIGDCPQAYMILPIYMQREDFDMSKAPTEPIVSATRICNIFQVEIKEKVKPICVFVEDNTDPQAIFLKYVEEDGDKKLAVFCQTKINEQVGIIAKKLAKELIN